MCLGIPGEVIEFLPDQPDLAKVNVSGVRRVINIGLLADDPPKPGEWVLIRAQTRHRVVETVAGTHWLAVHIHPAPLT